MEHSSHAHPSSDGRRTPSIRRSASSATPCAVGSPKPTSPQQGECFSQQTRRLQLRNTCFRGPVLPFRRISPLLGASANGIESFARSMNNDDSPLSAEKRVLYGEHLPPSPVNIMQEIHSLSSRKKRTAPRPGIEAIFEDNAGKENMYETSWYNGGSNDCSPSAQTAIYPKMNQLRETSGNSTSPPSLSSPLVKRVRNRNSDRSSLRSASFETAQHIEHLESELASAHAKLESQNSPRTTKLRAGKLRALTTENRNLKHEISEWQGNLDERIQEERMKRLDADLELRSSMRMLEDELEMKDARVAELEWELESLRVKVRDLEGLEDINVKLEKRIEALTNLLVQSPSKVGSSAATSPVRRESLKRTPRPRSMLPRVPGSPTALRMSLPTVSESTMGRSRSFGCCSNTPESPNEDLLQDCTIEDLQSPIGDEDPLSSRSSRHSGSVGERSRPSASLRSAPSSASRPTSMRSSCSFRPISWGSPEHENRSPTRLRKMRRFPSGSSSLKPLILPASTVTLPLPASGLIFGSIDETAERAVSDTSLDPTTAFLSNIADSSAPCTPDQLCQQQSATWVQEQTLKALEGKFRETKDVSGVPMLECREQRAEELSMGFKEIPQGKQKSRSRPRSLRKELEEAEKEQALRELKENNFVIVYDDGLLPDDENNNPEQIMTGKGHTPTQQALLTNFLQQPRQASQNNDPTPKQPQKHPSPATPPLQTLPPSTLTSSHAHTLFSRLINLLTRIKQEPFILARRILANAWSQGSSRLGGIAWWLLGPIYCTRWLQRKRVADSATVADGERTCFNWRHISVVAGDGGCVQQKRESWLSPPHFTTPSTDFKGGASRRKEPHLFPCAECVEPSSRRTLKLWIQFSLAIILAVGIAVKNGPGTLLCNDDGPQTHHHYHHHPHPQSHTSRSSIGRKRLEPKPQSHNRAHTRSHSSSGNSRDTNGLDSGYGSIVFAETLGPKDFEDQ